MIRHTVVITSALLLGAAAGSSAATYTITDLGPTYPQQINNAGQVLVGVPGGSTYLWDGGQSLAFPQPAGGSFHGAALNDLGQVTGFVNYGSSYNYYLATYSQGSLSIDDAIAGVSPSGINNGGQVVGTRCSPTAVPLLRGVLTLIGPSGYESVVTGLNQAGDAVGFVFRLSGLNSSNAFLCSNGKFTLLPAPESVLRSSASAINDSGEIAGTYQYTANLVSTRLFLNGPSGLVDLGFAFGDGAESDGVGGINDAGTVVGGSSIGLLKVAWTYQVGLGFTNLNTEIPNGTGWTLGFANSINEAGQIVGTGTLNGQERGFLLTPTPEPATVGMMAMAVGWGLWARRQWRRI